MLSSLSAVLNPSGLKQNGLPSTTCRFVSQSLLLDVGVLHRRFVWVLSNVSHLRALELYMDLWLLKR